jgi:hypothetical protein
MKSHAETILRRAAGLPEGTPVGAEIFLDLGARAAINQALLSLFREQKLMRVGRGTYVLPIVSRFGSSAPSAHLLIEELSKQRGEVIVPSGATSANALGLTTQVPVQMVYWTSGRSRELNLGKLVLHLSHVPSWQRYGTRRRDRPRSCVGRPAKSSRRFEEDRGKGSPNRASESRAAKPPVFQAGSRVQ